jgi:hypothetical protein
MGYTVPSIINTKNYVLANGVALFLAYAVPPYIPRLIFFSKQ